MGLFRNVTVPLESLRPPQDTAGELWRYMSLAHFLALVDSKRLFFPWVSRFEDRFEAYLANPRHCPLSDPPDPTHPVHLEREEEFDRQKGAWGVSCWYEVRETPGAIMPIGDSMLMWKTYGGRGASVAVVSSADCIKTALEDRRTLVQAGAVDYARTTSDGPIEFDKALFCKHQAFRQENEYRFVVSGEIARNWAINNGDDDVALLLETLSPRGVALPVCVDNLVKHVWLSPGTTDSEVKAVRKATKALGVDVKIAVTLADTTVGML